ncbi:MAG: metalloregulator ArsR/SmtB family transcription factor [Microbacteriaceae bacterium]|nr:metalloregulator ArsR/SmtB family transcription factor [Microbacteriaceae bacterium]MCL2795927.1 metalloregulator ArsR/SmtB family transcription factor [Microbacteriaceae bacterium]
MLNQSEALDRAFQALADPTRRAMVERLSRGPASVSDLAAPLAMTMAAVLQHLRVLEASGLVTSAKQGRVRTCAVDPEAFGAVQSWIDERRREWDRRLDALTRHLVDHPELPARPAQPASKKEEK